MTAEQGVFLFISFVILFSAYAMVTRSNLVHAALFLVVTLFGVAVVFVLLDAGFLAVVQVLVYIGAIRGHRYPDDLRCHAHSRQRRQRTREPEH